MESSVVSGGQPASEGKPAKRPLVESVWARAAIVIAVAEAVLVVVGVIPRWTAVVVAALVLAAYFYRGRKVSNPSTRQGFWAVAVSQALVLFVPLALWILGAVVIVIVAAAAVILLVVLLADR
jgi:uncharacterized membrane protein YphA (DoxX/SURF4 family)